MGDIYYFLQHIFLCSNVGLKEDIWRERRKEKEKNTVSNLISSFQKGNSPQPCPSPQKSLITMSKFRKELNLKNR